MIDLGALTDLVLSELESGLTAAGFTDPLVGDGVAPVEGGWVDGQPGSGLFRPYVVLVSGGAAPRWQDAGAYTPVWAVTWMLRSSGGSRRQADAMATAVRGCVESLGKATFGSPPWKVMSVEWGSLGATVRNDATSPASWQVSDSVLLPCDT